MAARHQVRIYLDVVSPWSRLAYESLKGYRKAWNLDLVLTPINLGYVMKWANNRPPISVINKGLWMNADMERAEKFFGVTLNRPPEFPPNTFFAMSLLRLIQKEQAAETFERALDAFFAAVWTDNHLLETPEQLGQVMTKNKIITDEATLRSLIERAYLKENKAALGSEAKVLAEEGGCFGAPWIVVTRKSDGRTETFFGSDRMEIIAAFLEEPYLGPRADRSVPKL